MEDVYFYMMLNFCDVVDITMLSFVNHTFLKLYEFFKIHKDDVIYKSIENKLYHLTKFLLNQNYYLNYKNANQSILHHQFDILKFYDGEFDGVSLTNAVLSNNIKMVRYIKNRINDYYNLPVGIILKVDNLEIYKELFPKATIDVGIIRIMVNCHSVNIIECYRFGKNRQEFERLVVDVADQLNDEFMINYFLEHGYGLH